MNGTMIGRCFAILARLEKRRTPMNSREAMEITGRKNLCDGRLYLKSLESAKRGEIGKGPSLSYVFGRCLRALDLARSVKSFDAFDLGDAIGCSHKQCYPYIHEMSRFFPVREVRPTRYAGKGGGRGRMAAIYAMEE